MTMLADLQEQLLAHLLSRDEAVTGCILDNALLDRSRRLAIYADGYRLRLLDALSENYPALHTLLGDERFRALGLAYLDVHPSRHFSIRYFGHRLAEFVETQTHLGAEQNLLREMAAFEWALSEAFDAQDAPATTLETVGAIPMEQWPNMRLTLHASVRRLDLGWNVPALWQAVDQEQGPIAPQRLERPLSWLIWRRTDKTLYRSLDPEEAWAIDCVLTGADFATLCDGLANDRPEEDAASYAAGLLRR